MKAFGTRKLAEPSLPKSPQAVAQVDFRLLYTQRAPNDLGEVLGHIARDDDKTALSFLESYGV
jgi:hypothetical protein